MMCLTQAGRLVEVDHELSEAVIEIGGGRRRVSIAPLVVDGADPRAGDWVLIHSGLAISVIDESEALALAELIGGPEGGEP